MMTTNRLYAPTRALPAIAAALALSSTTAFAQEAQPTTTAPPTTADTPPRPHRPAGAGRAGSDHGHDHDGAGDRHVNTGDDHDREPVRETHCPHDADLGGEAGAGGYAHGDTDRDQPRRGSCCDCHCG